MVSHPSSLVLCITVCVDRSSVQYCRRDFVLSLLQFPSLSLSSNLLYAVKPTLLSDFSVTYQLGNITEVMQHCLVLRLEAVQVLSE